MNKRNKIHFSLPIAATTGGHVILRLQKKYVFIILSLILTVSGFGLFQSARLSAAVKTIESTEKKLNSAQLEKQHLTEENQHINQNMEALKKQAENLESEVSELNEIKSDIYNKLDPLGIKAPENTTSLSDTEQSSNSADIVEETSSKLLTLEENINIEKISYIDINENVTELLANLNSTPNTLPVSGIITSYFGSRTDPINGNSANHEAIDIYVPENTPVKATAAGTVTYSEFNSGGYGYMVKISHNNGLETLYAHNSKLSVSVGEKVNKGDIIAYSGSTGRVTGPHVHYELIVNGIKTDPFSYIK